MLQNCEAVALSHQLIPCSQPDAASRHSGVVPDLVILHGMFGSHKNWGAQANAFSPYANIYLIDLRNHGLSPHTEHHTLCGMVADLSAWLTLHLPSDRRPILLGHSMGGLVAMAAALQSSRTTSGLLPQMIEPRAVVVADIAPRHYEHRHDNELAALSIDPSQYSSRAEVDQQMAKHVGNSAVRRFLQMNLVHEKGIYRWRINSEALAASAYLNEWRLFAADEASWTGPLLAVVGGRSDFVRSDDHPLFYRHFPATKIVTLPEADHWLHYSAAEDFRGSVVDFIESLD